MPKTHAGQAPSPEVAQHLKRITRVWLLLIVATVLSVLLNTLMSSVSLVVIAALIITVIKSQLVGDFFMEMRHAPALWRTLLTLYVILIPGVCGAIYLFALQ